MISFAIYKRNGSAKEMPMLQFDVEKAIFVWKGKYTLWNNEEKCKKDFVPIDVLELGNEQYQLKDPFEMEQSLAAWTLEL